MTLESLSKQLSQTNQTLTYQGEINMFTAEQLLNAVDRPTYVLTKAEAQNRANNMPRQSTFISVVNRSKGVAFFTNDHCFGYDVLPDDFTSCTSVVPQTVVPRKGLESGVITNIDEYVAVYYDDCRIIESTQELVDYLNNEYAHVND